MCYSAATFVLLFALFPDIAVGDEDSLKDFDDKSPKDEKVLEGKPLDPPHSRPYIAQLRDLYGEREVAVGGTIYDKYTIITSNGNKNAYRVFAGKYYFQQTESSQQERKVCWVSLKSERPAAIDSYTLIHLDKPLSFNKFVQPANLTEFGGKVADSNCRLTGWGAWYDDIDPNNSEVLLEARVRILRWKDCSTGRNHSSLMCLSNNVAELDQGSPITCSDKSGRDVVSGYALWYGETHMADIVASLAGLSQDWIEKQLAIGAWKCGRGPPPTTRPPRTTTTTTRPTTTTPPPVKDCCSNDGKTNGFPAIPHSRPFIVQIHTKGSKEVSVGVLINAYTVVASAHKLKDILKVTAGKHLFGKYEGTQQARRPCHASQHTSLDRPANAFAYGLIHLSDPFVLNEYVNGISIAPKGALVPKENCSIIGWQGNTAETELREQSVKFKDPKTCKTPHETIACVEAGACLHDWGSPVICSHDSKIYFHAIASSADAYCKDALLASIPALPRDWLANELRDAETKCGKSTL